MITDLKGKTILIVDDDPVSLYLFSEILQQTNAVILCANDGATALNILHKQPVDLVLLDIKLTDMTGFEVLKEIRKNFKPTKVIAQTAYAFEVIQECREAGFDDYIAKPINADELFDKIERLING